MAATRPARLRYPGSVLPGATAGVWATTDGGYFLMDYWGGDRRQLALSSNVHPSANLSIDLIYTHNNVDHPAGSFVPERERHRGGENVRERAADGVQVRAAHPRALDGHDQLVRSLDGGFRDLLDGRHLAVC